MVNKSKRNGSKWLILGGLFIFVRYFFKLEDNNHYTNNIIIMICALIITIIGVISFRKNLKE